MSWNPCFAPFQVGEQVRIEVVCRVRFSRRPWPLSIVVATRRGPGGGRSSGGSGRRDRSGGGLEGEASAKVGPQSRLVVFHGEDGIAAGLDHRFREIPLAEDRIADHDFSFQGQEAKESQGGLVLIGAGLDPNLREHGADRRGVGREQGLARNLAIAGTAKGLAVDRDLRDGLRVDPTGDPAGKDGFELVGVEASEGAGPGGNGGRLAASEAEGVGQGRTVLAAEAGDAGEAGASQKHGEHDEREEGREGVELSVSAPGIRKFGQRLDERDRGPGAPSWRDEGARNTQMLRHGQGESRNDPDSRFSCETRKGSRIVSFRCPSKPGAGFGRRSNG